MIRPNQRSVDHAEQQQDRQTKAQREWNPSPGTQWFVGCGIGSGVCRDDHALSLRPADGTVNPSFSESRAAVAPLWEASMCRVDAPGRRMMWARLDSPRAFGQNPQRQKE